jgi:hypothetical protein
MPSNLPDSGNIPDMSLGERSDPPAAPIQTAPATAYQPPAKPDALSANALPARREEPASDDWQEGDRVLAPWEPTFLYPGRIKQIVLDDARGDQALIHFDDGGEGWVFLYSLFQLEIQPGQHVLVRRRGGVQFFHAAVVDADGEEVHVRYDDGSEEWTTIVFLAVASVANGPGVFNGKPAPWQLSAAPTGSGIPSWAIWVGIAVISAIFRAGCQAMNHH